MERIFKKVHLMALSCRKRKEGEKRNLPVIFLDVGSENPFYKERDFLLLHESLELLSGQLPKVLTPVSPIHFRNNGVTHVLRVFFRGACTAHRTN